MLQNRRMEKVKIKMISTDTNTTVCNFIKGVFIIIGARYILGITIKLY